jgi:hypothetical protein
MQPLIAKNAAFSLTFIFSITRAGGQNEKPERYSRDTGGHRVGHRGDLLFLQVCD